MSNNTYDKHDIQGIVLRGYGDLPAAYYLLLSIKDAPQVKRWLAHLAEEIEPWKWPKGAASAEELRTRAVHIAFTRSGLEKLGLKKEHTLFSCEFEQGMTTKHKQRTLGDFCEKKEDVEPPEKVDPACRNDPKDWAWGGTQDGAPQVDILVMLYGGPTTKEDAERLDELRGVPDPSPAQRQELARLSAAAEKALDGVIDFHVGHIQQAGVEIISKLGTRTLIKRKEHFGFHDGVSQPIFDQTSLADRLKQDAADLRTLAGKEPDKKKRKKLQARAEAIESNIIKPGEFVLGYPNEYDKMPVSPRIPARLDPQNLLKDAGEGTRDFGRNGTYLVFRQLEQDVKEFWDYVDRQTNTPEERDWLAAKMVGRWRSGAPLVSAPHADDPQREFENDFGYQSDDYGDKCPLGSHIRRGNPRDAVMPGTDDLLTTSKVHRILRRGRAYGDPVADSMEPDDILRAEPDDKARGLHFICFNTDIGRQFEFVQHTWLNNQKFSGLYSELDPIVGAPHPRHRDQKGTFTVEDFPLRKRYTGVERYVHIRGGAYFFLPGINAVRALARLP